MDHGETAILCGRAKQPPGGARIVELIIAFSRDGDATWSDFRPVTGTGGRPQYLFDLGGSRLCFITEAFDRGTRPQRPCSNHRGRNYPQQADDPPTRGDLAVHGEGYAWVDRDGRALARAVLELGWRCAPRKSHPKDDATASWPAAGGAVVR
jgi:hypothetical protein